LGLRLLRRGLVVVGDFLAFMLAFIGLGTVVDISAFLTKSALRPLVVCMQTTPK
jgi:hypothetical protein